MKIAVLTKAIPSYESSIRVDSSGSWIDESVVNFVVNESDSYALEEALQIKEQLNDDSEVVVVIMGNENNTSKVLKDGLAKGADRGIFINNENIDTDPLSSLKGIMGAKRKDVKSVSASSSGDNKQKFIELFIPKTEKVTERIEGDVDSIVARMLDILKNTLKVI